jgi:glutaconate CoA-transferase subunit B
LKLEPFELFVFMCPKVTSVFGKFFVSIVPNFTGSREAAGLSPGGPSAVVTNMAVLELDENTREMYLRNHYPGVFPEQVSENMGFQINLARSMEMRPPSDKELKFLRELCDPQRLILD